MRLKATSHVQIVIMWYTEMWEGLYSDLCSSRSWVKLYKNGQTVGHVDSTFNR